MTKDDLQKTYSNLSTYELLEIIDRKYDYTDLAITMAIEEISKRQVSEDDIRDYKAEQLNKTRIFIRKNFLDDLSMVQKNLFYFIWVPFVNFALRQDFKDDGYILKLKQANYYSLAGLVLFLGTGLISAAFNFSIYTSLATWILGFLAAYSFDEFFIRRMQIERLKKLFESHAKENRDQG